MGGFLSAPLEVIRIQRKGSTTYKMGVAEMQGWRANHEDCHSMRSDDTCGEFFVLDGHGGDGGALYGAPGLAEEFKGCGGSGYLPDEPKITEGFSKVDRNLRKHFAEHPDKASGSTVVGAISTKDADGSYSVKMLNCGDYRGVILWPATMTKEAAAELEMSVPDHLTKLAADGYEEEMQSKGGMAGRPGRSMGFPLIMESIDHKPSHPTEKGRIEAAGGTVSADDCPRLDGNLAVSRGLGDFEYKKGEDLPVAEQKVSCVPDVYEMKGLPAGSILVLACDGVWDVMNGMDVANMVLEPLREDPNADLGAISAEIIKHCLKLNSRDNITAMIVVFEDGEKWAEEKDEMVVFEKMLEGEMEDDVKKQYDAFLRKCGFPLKPVVCDVCERWLGDMQQCPCKECHYCNKLCQKKGWKTHKLVCIAVPGNSKEGAIKDKDAKPKKGSSKKK